MALDRLSPALQQKVEGAADRVAHEDPAGMTQLKQLVAAHSNRGHILAAMGAALEARGVLEMALAMWKAAWELDRRDVAALEGQARCAAQLGRLEEAATARARATGAGAARASFDRASQLYRARRYDDAIAALREGLALATDDVLGWIALSDSLREAGRFDEALDALKEVRRRHPGHAGAVDAVERIGRTLMAMGRGAEAQQALGAWHSLRVQRYGPASSPLHGREPVMLRETAIEARAQERVEIAPSRPIEVPSPRYVPAFREDGPQTEPSPALSVSEVHDVEVVGQSGVVTSGDDLLVYDESLSPRLRQDNVPEYSGWNHPNGATLVFRPRAVTRRIEAAILVGGRAAQNYFHWTLEHLPKVLFAAQLPGSEGLPLLVNAELPAQCREALALLAPGREVIPMTDASRVAVGRLVVSSLGGMIPDDPRVPFSRMMIAPETVRRLRAAVLGAVDTRDAETPRRVMLTRRSARRGCLNEEAIAASLEARGFTLVDPVSLSFREQVQLFANAETVVLTVGAAMTNVVFMPEGARMFGLWGESAPPHYFAGLGRAAGVDLAFVRGDQIPGSHPDPIHRDFVVPEDALLDAVEGRRAA